MTVYFCEAFCITSINLRLFIFAFSSFFLANESGKWLLRGSLVNTCTKLDTEFFKLLQNSDQHSEEYRSRLRHNQDIIQLFNEGNEWFLLFSIDFNNLIFRLFLRSTTFSGGFLFWRFVSNLKSSLFNRMKLWESYLFWFGF